MLKLGFSVYVSTFNKQKDFLKTLQCKDAYIFTSLHIAEEMGEGYVQRAKKMLECLNAWGFKVIGDVSKRTLEVFEEPDITALAKNLGLHMIRIDYGFSEEEMLAAVTKMPLVFNASTVDVELAKKLKAVSGEVFAIHNYYPREYTGLSKKQFDNINKELRENGIQVIGFIPNSKASRGPIYEGLPTVEHHRYVPSYVSYLEMINKAELDGILLSDLKLDELDKQMIETYEKAGIISIPTKLEKPFEHLYDQVFTIRIDSPECAYRLQESREFATAGIEIEPCQCTSRTVGSITCDNKHFARYSGEIQIIREELPKDNRVNIIGEVASPYKKICQFIENGQKIKIIRY